MSGKEGGGGGDSGAPLRDLGLRDPLLCGCPGGAGYSVRDGERETEEGDFMGQDREWHLSLQLTLSWPDSFARPFLDLIKV